MDKISNPEIQTSTLPLYTQALKPLTLNIHQNFTEDIYTKLTHKAVRSRSKMAGNQDIIVKWKVIEAIHQTSGGQRSEKCEVCVCVYEGSIA